MNLWGEEEGIVSNAGLEQIKEVKNKYKIGKKKKISFQVNCIAEAESQTKRIFIFYDSHVNFQDLVDYSCKNVLEKKDCLKKRLVKISQNMLILQIKFIVSKAFLANRGDKIKALAIFISTIPS